MLVGLIELLIPKASSALVGLNLPNGSLYPRASYDLDAASYWCVPLLSVDSYAEGMTLWVHDSLHPHPKPCWKGLNAWRAKPILVRSNYKPQ